MPAPAQGKRFAIAAAALLLLTPTLLHAQVSFTWATIGSPGNPSDPANDVA